MTSAALLIALSPLGCEESTQCPALPDARVADLSPAADSGPVTDTASACKASSVTCAAGELNAFGVCLAQGSMVEVAAGPFTMGHTEAGEPHDPEHTVTLSAFLIDKTEVTVAQYAACVACGGCAAPLRDGSHTGREPYYGNPAFDGYPVIYVSWTDAKAYCEGIGKRLPTEAEWEKAARGDDGRTYPWGEDKPAKGRANLLGVMNDTMAVTDNAAGASPAGALNMAGNVWEWVNDAYDPTYYAQSPATDPSGPALDTPLKVIRGGGFMSTPDQLRTFARAAEVDSAAYSYLGFRCAADSWPAP